ncbi:hypothetical protein [Lonsdalea quercina]|uniref:hypothetical protein n=1 Tax=Lonsdalea quercina TaxID=71657 RepID=UPI003974D230
MVKYKTLQEIADYLGDGGPFNPDDKYGNVGELVDAIVLLGNTDKVYVAHDDHMILKDGLSPELINLPLDEVNQEDFSDEIEEIVWQANKIIALSKRELKEEDEEDIKEDKLYRGDDEDYS